MNLTKEQISKLKQFYFDIFKNEVEERKLRISDKRINKIIKKILSFLFSVLSSGLFLLVFSAYYKFIFNISILDTWVYVPFFAIIGSLGGGMFIYNSLAKKIDKRYEDEKSKEFDNLYREYDFYLSLQDKANLSDENFCQWIHSIKITMQVIGHYEQIGSFTLSTIFTELFTGNNIKDNIVYIFKNELFNNAVKIKNIFDQLIDKVSLYEQINYNDWLKNISATNQSTKEIDDEQYVPLYQTPVTQQFYYQYQPSMPQQQSFHQYYSLLGEQLQPLSDDQNLSPIEEIMDQQYCYPIIFNNDNNRCYTKKRK